MKLDKNIDKHIDKHNDKRIWPCSSAACSPTVDRTPRTAASRRNQARKLPRLNTLTWSLDHLLFVREWQYIIREMRKKMLRAPACLCASGAIAVVSSQRRNTWSTTWPRRTSSRGRAAMTSPASGRSVRTIVRLLFKTVNISSLSSCSAKSVCRTILILKDKTYDTPKSNEIHKYKYVFSVRGGSFLHRCQSR